MDDEARARLARFVIDKLSKDEAAFEKDVALAIDGLLATPLENVLDPARLESGIASALAKEQVERGARPLSKTIHMAVIKGMRADTTKLGALVPPKARARIDKLLEKKRAVNEKLIRQLIEQEAMEETLRDVIFDALKEFNEKFNPFAADWGLPGLLKGLGRFGLGPLTKSIDNVRLEFDKRAEPEMRKFLQSFSRRAVRRMADLVVENDGGEKFIALRKSMVAFLYDQELRELVANVDDESAEAWNAIAVDVIEHSLALDVSKKKRADAIAMLLRDHGKEPLGRVLERYGFSAKPDAGAIARSMWPVARAIFQGPAAQKRVEAIVAEFFASEAK
ncbi:MAG TPA: hypothetical protein VH054_24275 [Polyangiaceae bacterium]|jgi:hypothetical protein|nr:hypothetical protein [Polyangiaceae bacterium]